MKRAQNPFSVYLDFWGSLRDREPDVTHTALNQSEWTRCDAKSHYIYEETDGRKSNSNCRVCFSAFRRRVASALRRRRQGSWKGRRGSRESRRGNLRLGRVPAQGRASRGERHLRLRLSRPTGHQQDDDVHHISDLSVHCAYLDVHLRWVKKNPRRRRERERREQKIKNKKETKTRCN